MQIGQSGATDKVMAEIDRALTAHELIKVKILGDDREARAEIATAVATRADAALVQSVGKVVVLWRPNPDES